MKDGSVVRTCAVLEKVEKVAVWYRHSDSRNLRTYGVDEVIYDGSDCTPSYEDDKHTTVYAFKAEVRDPCLIKENAKIVVVYKDGTREEMCGRYAGISAYYVEYRSCIDVDADKVFMVELVSMGFMPIQNGLSQQKAQPNV